MACIKVFFLCLGLILVARYGDAQPALTQTTITVAENTAGAVGSVTASGSPQSATILSQSNTDQFTVAVNAGNTALDFTLAAGYTLSYETATTLTVAVQMVDSTPATATGTVSITVTDVANEYLNTIMFVCLSGTSYGSTASVGTYAVTSGASGTYAISSQTPAGLLDITTATGELKVASGKTINSAIVPISSLTLAATISGTTHNTALTLAFGCSTSSSAALSISSITLLLAALLTRLQ